MAVFCSKTGVRLIAPTGNESADYVAFTTRASKRVVDLNEELAALKAAEPNNIQKRAELEGEIAKASKRLEPVSTDVDPEEGWAPVPPPPRKPKPQPQTTAAPSVERAPQPVAFATQDAPRKGNK